MITISWTVDGDETKCKYYLKEKDGGVKIKKPNGKVTISAGTPKEDWFELGQRVYRDATGIFLEGNGNYVLEYNLKQWYKCEDSDGTPHEVGPKTYKKKATLKWPPSSKK